MLQNIFFFCLKNIPSFVLDILQLKGWSIFVIWVLLDLICQECCWVRDLRLINKKEKKISFM